MLFTHFPVLLSLADKTDMPKKKRQTRKKVASSATTGAAVSGVAPPVEGRLRVVVWVHVSPTTNCAVERNMIYAF